MPSHHNLYKLTAIMMFLFIACQTSQNSTEQQKIITEINKYRAEKDSVFRQADWSPIPEEDRTNFQGLHYFPIDLSLRFVEPINLYETAQPDTIVGTKGDLRPALKYGYFAFSYKNRPYELQIYQMIPKDTSREKYLFLGFTDQTTGKETYNTGRYIDLLELPDGDYVVDFNLAYNPYCAYNPRYTCAIPPSENKLPFKVLAGERIFKQH